MDTKRSVLASLAAGILIGAVCFAVAEHYVLPAYAATARIILVDPDPDDVANGKLKTRENGDGTIRAAIEFELHEVTLGAAYTIRLEVTEVGGAPIPPLEVGPLTAQPPTGP